MDVMTLTFVVAAVAGVYLVTHWMLRFRQRSHTDTREDVLKQVYHLREKRKDVTIESLAGALHRSRDEVSSVISLLQSRGFLESHGEQIRLTEQGTTAALELIRSHRLWERYLADETGVREERWHAEAERQEHRLSTEEADALSRRLGNPMYDPHGDPIPQKDLGLPGPKGLSLSNATEGEEYVIIHLEDEPSAVYEELVRNKVFRGSRIRLLGREKATARLECDRREITLPLLALTNITVAPSRGRRPEPLSPYTLSELQTGQQATVTGLSPACRGMQRRRLLDLGVLPGTIVTAELRSPLGDPVGYRIRGSVVALRDQEASLVHVRKQGEA